MAKKEMIVHRVCRYCHEYTQVVKNWEGPPPPGTIECPKCKRFGLELRTVSQIEYMEWKGTIGAGKQLRETIKTLNKE
jgi:hypothetical protein